jgi:hypothetical protein
MPLGRPSQASLRGVACQRHAETPACDSHASPAAIGSRGPSTSRSARDGGRGCGQASPPAHPTPPVSSPQTLVDNPCRHTHLASARGRGGGPLPRAGPGSRAWASPPVAGPLPWAGPDESLQPPRDSDRRSRLPSLRPGAGARGEKAARAWPRVVPCVHGHSLLTGQGGFGQGGLGQAPLLVRCSGVPTFRPPPPPLLPLRSKAYDSMGSRDRTRSKARLGRGGEGGLGSDSVREPAAGASESSWGGRLGLVTRSA